MTFLEDNGLVLAAVVLTLTLTIIAAGGTWLVIGNRLRLNEDPRQNEVLNFLVYAALVLPLAYLVVFFAVERL